MGRLPDHFIISLLIITFMHPNTHHQFTFALRNQNNANTPHFHTPTLSTHQYTQIHPSEPLNTPQTSNTKTNIWGGQNKSSLQRLGWQGGMISQMGRGMSLIKRSQKQRQKQLQKMGYFLQFNEDSYGQQQGKSIRSVKSFRERIIKHGVMKKIGSQRQQAKEGGRKSLRDIFQINQQHSNKLILFDNRNSLIKVSPTNQDNSHHSCKILRRNRRQSPNHDTIKINNFILSPLPRKLQLSDTKRMKQNIQQPKKTVQSRQQSKNMVFEVQRRNKILKNLSYKNKGNLRIANKLNNERLEAFTKGQQKMQQSY